MSDLKVYDVQPGGPRKTVLVYWYQRWRSPYTVAKLTHMDVVGFAEYLLEHLVDFQAELAEYKALEKQPCPVCGKPGIEHSYTQRIACLEKQMNHPEAK